MHLVDVDTEFFQRGTDLGGGGPPTRRLEREVHRGGNPPTEHDRCEEVVGKRSTQVHRRQREQKHEKLTDATCRTSQIGRRRAHDRGDDREAHLRERRRVVTEAHHDFEALGQRPVAHELAERAPDCPRERPREEEVARESPAPSDEGRRDDQRHRPQRAHAVRTAEQRAQAVGQRVEELEDVALRCRDVAGVPRQHVDDDHREGEAHPIACPALVRLLRGGTEGGVPPAAKPPRLRLGRGASLGRGRGRG